MLCRSFVGRFVALNRSVAISKSLFFKNKCSQAVAVRSVGRQLVTVKCHSSLLKVGSVIASHQRFKAKRKGKQEKHEEKEGEDDEDESDVEELQNLPETMKVDSPSLKAEFILTRCLFKSRALLEDSIAKQRLRVNSEQLEVKDMEVAAGDVFDHILGRSNDNYDYLIVNRVTIMKLPDKFVKGRAVLEVERCLRLTIPDYKNKWEGISLHQEKDQQKK